MCRISSKRLVPISVSKADIIFITDTVYAAACLAYSFLSIRSCCRVNLAENRMDSIICLISIKINKLFKNCLTITVGRLIIIMYKYRSSVAFLICEQKVNCKRIRIISCKAESCRVVSKQWTRFCCRNAKIVRRKLYVKTK